MKKIKEILSLLREMFTELLKDDHDIILEEPQKRRK